MYPNQSELKTREEVKVETRESNLLLTPFGQKTLTNI